MKNADLCRVSQPSRQRWAQFYPLFISAVSKHLLLYCVCFYEVLELEEWHTLTWRTRLITPRSRWQHFLVSCQYLVSSPQWCISAGGSSDLEMSEWFSLLPNKWTTAILFRATLTVASVLKWWFILEAIFTPLQLLLCRKSPCVN